MRSLVRLPGKLGRRIIFSMSNKKLISYIIRKYLSKQFKDFEKSNSFLKNEIIFKINNLYRKNDEILVEFFYNFYIKSLIFKWDQYFIEYYLVIDNKPILNYYYNGVYISNPNFMEQIYNDIKDIMNHE